MRQSKKTDNKCINENLVEGKVKPNTKAIKTSQVKFVTLGTIQGLIIPFLDFIISSNTFHYGFDLFQLHRSKRLNYNTYKEIN